MICENIFYYASKYLKKYILILILIVFPLLNALFNSYFFAKYIGLTIDSLSKDNYPLAEQSLLKVIGVITLLQIIFFIQNRFLSSLLSKTTELIKNQGIDKLFKLPFKDLKPSMVNTINSLSFTVANTISLFVLYVYNPICGLLISNYFMIKMNKDLSFTLIIFTTIFITILYLIIKSTLKYSKKLTQQEVENESLLEDISRNFFFEKLFMLKDFTTKFYKKNIKIEASFLKNKFDFMALGSFICNSLCAVACGILLMMTLKSSMPLSLKIANIALIERFFSNLTDFSKNLIPLLNNLGSIKVGLDFFTKEEELEKKRVSMKVEKIEIKNLTFSYDQNIDILKNKSIEIKKGLNIIEGESGGGKSTLIKIICGLIEPKTGEVLFNGEIIKNKNILKNISFMPQMDGIYNRKVIENIDLSKDSTEIIEKIEEFKMHNILHQTCGINGQNISGGENRRISLLRMLNFYKEGNVMIFDEPFVGLNQSLVKFMINFILSFREDHIVIIVDHTNILHSYNPTIFTI